jgi:hypothetical protein
LTANAIRPTRLPSRLIPTATAVAVTVSAAIVLLIVYYAIGGPFGTLNDLANALLGVLSVVLAAQTARLGVPAAAVAAAGAGGVLMVVGSWLVITGRTGWVLAGLVGAVGAGALGAWLLTVNVTAGRYGLLSRPVARLGAVSGALTMLGILAMPDVLARVDAWDDLHWSGILALMSWLSLYLGYPVWCVLLARAAGQRRTG